MAKKIGGRGNRRGFFRIDPVQVARCLRGSLAAALHRPIARLPPNPDTIHEFAPKAW